MSYEENSKHEIYYIPQNYEDAGGVLGGRFSQRNVIEMAVICGPIVFIIAQLYSTFSLSFETLIIISTVTLLPLLALCAFGIKGESISQILFAFIRYRRNRRKLSYISFVDADEMKALAANPWALNTLLDNIETMGFKKAIEKAKADSKAIKEAKKNLAEDDEDESSATKKRSKKIKPNHVFEEHQERTGKEKPHRPKDLNTTSSAWENLYKNNTANAKKAEHHDRRQQVSRGLFSSAMKESILNKLELGEENDDYYML